MKHLFSKLVISLAAGLLLLAACEKDLELKISEQGGQLVLFSFLTADSLFKVHVSKSVSHLSINDFERVYNATVKVFQNEALVDSFLFPFDKLWATRNHLSINEGDTFRVVVNDGANLTATGQTIIPNAVPIVKLDTATKSVLSPEGIIQEMLNCTITIPDPPDEDNYYQLYLMEVTCTITGNDTICMHQRIEFSKDDPVFYYRDQEGSLLGGIDFEGTFSDFLFNGTHYELSIRLPLSYAARPAPGTRRTLYFMLISQTEDYYNYFRSRVVAEYSYDLPIIDPIRIFYNVEDGLGLVGGLSVAADSLVFLSLPD